MLKVVFKPTSVPELESLIVVIHEDDVENAIAGARTLLKLDKKDWSVVRVVTAEDSSKAR